MKAVDANILLRWITRDDERQAALADAVMRHPVLVTPTVLIEVAWVLKRSYRLDRVTLNDAVTTIIDLDTVTVADDAGVRWALHRHAVGADLPDMLHLVAAKGASAFVTFDQRLANHAGAESPVPVEVAR